MRTIGLVVESTDDLFGKETVRGALEGLGGSDARLVCFTGGIFGSIYGYEARRALLYDLIGPRCVDGLLLSGTLSHYLGHRNLDDLCRRFRDIPLVTLAVSSAGFPAVMTDNRGGLGLLMDHLLGFHGFSKLAFLGGPRGQQEAEIRKAVFLEKMAARGGLVRPEWVMEGDFTMVSGEAAARDLVRNLGLVPGKLPFEGIVAANDLMAMGLIQYLTTRGWVFPRDCVVTGFDDHPRSVIFNPPLTTVVQSPARVAREASRKLLDILDGKSGSLSWNLDLKLVVRESCGCSFPGPVTDMAHGLEVSQGENMERAREISMMSDVVDRLRPTAENLQACGSFSEVLETLDQNLHRMGYTSYWLSLLDDPSDMSRTARLHLSRVQGGSVCISPEGIPFPSLDLVPGGLPGLEDDSFFRVVEILHSREQILGYLVLESNFWNAQASGTLRGLVSGALQSVFLMEDREFAERRLAQAEKMAALGTLVAGVAHEMNTPLGVAITAASYQEERLSGFTERFRSGQNTPGEADAFFLAMTESGTLLRSTLQRAADLVTTFKQVATDQEQESRRTFRLKEYLGLIFEGNRSQWEGKSVEISLSGDDELTVDSYPGVLYQVMSSLLNNSLVHGFSHGPGGLIRITVEDRGPQVLVCYSDNGAGIPEELQPNVFEPFFTTRRGQGGLGLGLHILFNLVTKVLGGAVTFRSVPGSETRFEIFIPKEAPGKDNQRTTR